MVAKKFFEERKNNGFSRVEMDLYIEFVEKVQYAEKPPLSKELRSAMVLTFSMEESPINQMASRTGRSWLHSR